MNTFLITALFASLVGSNDITAQTDTINKYTVDGKVVYNFDGSQLENKTILSYDITVAPENKGKKDGNVVRTHEIKTAEGMLNYDDASATNGNARVSLRYSSTQEKPLVIVDDKEYKGTIESIDPATIKTITVLKDKAAIEVYGDKGKDGVVMIETKK